MRSVIDLTRRGRTGLLVAALGTAALLLAPINARADDKPAPQKPACWRPAIVDGQHLQPGRAELDKCPPATRLEAAPATRSSAGERPPIDADEAFILDVIRRYAVQPSSTAALPEH